MIKKILATCILSALSMSASAQMGGRVMIQDRELGLLNSDHARTFLSDQRTSQENYNRAWAFYYHFVNDIRSLNQTACFAGNPQAALQSLESIVQSKVAGKNGEEINTLRNLSYDQASDSISFERMNVRPEIVADEGHFISVRLLRCGRVRPAAAPLAESLISRSDFRPDLTFLSSLGLARRAAQLVALKDMTYRSTGIAANEQCYVFGDPIEQSDVRAGQTFDLIYSLRLGYSNASAAAQQRNRDSQGKFVMRLEDQDRIQVRVYCALPTGASVQDLKQALNGLFEIKD